MIIKGAQILSNVLTFLSKSSDIEIYKIRNKINNYISNFYQKFEYTRPEILKKIMNLYFFSTETLTVHICRFVEPLYDRIYSYEEIKR